MRSSTDTTTKTMLVLALLAALAVLLRLGENLLPLPVQLGVIRPGLANTITILCRYCFRNGNVFAATAPVSNPKGNDKRSSNGSRENKEKLCIIREAVRI